MTESGAGPDFDGPACGFQGWCAREAGHIGDHRADPSDPTGVMAGALYEAALDGTLPNLNPDRIFVGGRPAAPDPKEDRNGG